MLDVSSQDSPVELGRVMTPHIVRDVAQRLQEVTTRQDMHRVLLYQVTMRT